MDRKQFLIEKMKLKNIKEKINSISGVSIVNVYEHSNICENYIEQMDEIYKIDFPILTTKEIGDERYKYIEYLYKYTTLQLFLNKRYRIRHFQCIINLLK